MKFIKMSIPLCYVIFTLTLESGSGSGSGALENCSPSSSGSVGGLRVHGVSLEELGVKLS